MQPSQYPQARPTATVISSHAPLHSAHPMETPSFSKERPARSLMPRSTYSVTRSRNDNNNHNDNHNCNGSGDNDNRIDNGVNVNVNVNDGDISPLRRR